jgi:site-specific recombinase XerD
MSDIYGVGDYVRRARKLLRESDVDDNNKYYLNQWIDYLMADNAVGEKKINRYVQTFRVLHDAGVIDFDLKHADKSDVRRLVGRINMNKIPGKDYTAESRAELKKAVRKFYQFADESKEPEIVDFVSCDVKQKDRKTVDPSELPSPQTVVEMYREAKNPRDRLFVVFLWESGARIGELLNLDWNDIKDQGKYVNVKLDGKTGKRVVPVTDCQPLLKEWKQEQSVSGGASPIFTSFHSHERMSYSSARKQLHHMADRASVTRKVNPHSFRKSRATFMAHHGANVFQLMKMFGWRKIETAKQYVETVNSRVDGLVLKQSSRSDISKENLDESLTSTLQQWEKTPAEALQ